MHVGESESISAVLAVSALGVPVLHISKATVPHCGSWHVENCQAARVKSLYFFFLFFFSFFLGSLG